MRNGLSSKDILSAQDRIWINCINRLIDNVIADGKSCDRNRLCGSFELLKAFFNGNERRAGEYFMSYCTRIAVCPPGFIECCEDALGVAVQFDPSYILPEKLLQAAE